MKFSKHDKPLPRYLRRALHLGDIDRIQRALDRAVAGGYELEYLARHMGVDISELNDATSH